MVMLLRDWIAQVHPARGSTTPFEKPSRVDYYGMEGVVTVGCPGRPPTIVEARV